MTAFIQVYNNTLSSAAKSGDYSLERDAKNMKALTSQYADELDKLGITVKDDGSMEIRSSLFESASYSKFKNIFSMDSDYMQRTSSYAKRMERRSETLDNTALNELFADTGIGKNINIVL